VAADKTAGPANENSLFIHPYHLPVDSLEQPEHIGLL
jgi:hypothetical protein